MFDHASLKDWFQRENRELPWRVNPTPYAVWISEVMLQQTQVSVVIPYFDKWMAAFPTIHALAHASMEEVIKLWEGLGYYSRARNLHAGARYLVTHFDGKIPADINQLKLIKGIGDYTAGAILSFAFHQRCPAVDGNVLRVLSRYFKVEEDISKARVQKKLKELTGQILPTHEPWIISEALIELGATVCRRKPMCEICPLKQTCQARRDGVTAALPIKTTRGSAQKLYRAVAIIECCGYFLVRKVDDKLIMSGLHEFPYFEITHVKIEPQELLKLIEQRFKIKARYYQAHPETSHSFTQFHAFLYPFHFHSQHRDSIEGYKWMNVDELKQVAFPSGHRTVFSYLRSPA